MVCLSRAAHQPSPERAMTNPPHRSTSVKSCGTSSSPRIITSNLQQLALHVAQVMTEPQALLASSSAFISLTMGISALPLDFCEKARARNSHLN
jgi:hypothetical protein